MAIWRETPTVAQLNERMRDTLGELIEIRISEIGPDFLRARMPVDHRTMQPMGILHGGASVALAETVGSFAANLCVDTSRVLCLGQAISASHLRPARAGHVVATARAVSLGEERQVWQIEIRDDADRLTCVSMLTMAVVARRPGFDPWQR